MKRRTLYLAILFLACTAILAAVNAATQQPAAVMIDGDGNVVELEVIRVAR